MKPLIPLAAHVMRHLRASGPCTFPGILGYVRDQYAEAQDCDLACYAEVQDYDLACCLTILIRDGLVDLYDTGDAFDASPLERALDRLRGHEDDCL